MIRVDITTQAIPVCRYILQTVMNILRFQIALFQFHFFHLSSLIKLTIFAFKRYSIGAQALQWKVLQITEAVIYPGK